MRRCLLWICAAAATLGIAAGQAKSAPPSEIELKAAFVLNFLRYTTWPDESASTLAICAIGNSDLGNAVRVAVSGKTVRNRNLLFRVERYPNAGECQVLLADGPQYSFSVPLLAHLAVEPVLTIGNGEGWIEMGGMIQLVVEDRRVRFDTNLGSARQVGLQLSALLVRLSRHVKK